MSAAQMEKHLFNLKFASKQLLRDSKKCEKEEKAEKLKLKKAIEKGNMEVARIHAENAIRQKSQALNFLRMSARVDAVASRVQTAVTTKRVTSSMQGVVKVRQLLHPTCGKARVVYLQKICVFLLAPPPPPQAMDSAMKSMNLEKISGLMDKFEKEFEDLDVQTSVMEGAMNQTTATNVPQVSTAYLFHVSTNLGGLGGFFF